MSNQEKKFSIPVNGNLIEVTEEVYRAYYQPIWRIQYHARKNGECICPKSQLWTCDGVCPGCRYSTAGRKVSIHTPISDDDPDLTLEDVLESSDPSPESILMERELLDALHEELDHLDPDGRRICELIMQNKTEREMAADLGRSQSTLNYQKRKVLSLLREVLKDYI